MASRAPVRATLAALLLISAAPEAQPLIELAEYVEAGAIVGAERLRSHLIAMVESGRGAADIEAILEASGFRCTVYSTARPQTRECTVVVRARPGPDAVIVVRHAARDLRATLRVATVFAK